MNPPGVAVDWLGQCCSDHAGNIARVDMACTPSLKCTGQLPTRLDRVGRPQKVLHEEVWLNEGERQTTVHHDMLGLSMLAAEGERGGWVRTDYRKLHEVPHSGLSCRLDEPRFAFDEPLVDRRQQQGSLYARECGCQRRGRIEVGSDGLDLGLCETCGLRLALNHRANLGSRATKSVDDETAVGACRSCHQDHDGWLLTPRRPVASIVPLERCLEAGGVIPAAPINASDSRRKKIDGERCALGSRSLPLHGANRSRRVMESDIDISVCRNERGKNAARASSPSSLTRSTEEHCRRPSRRGVVITPRRLLQRQASVQWMLFIPGINGVDLSGAIVQPSRGERR